MNATIFAWTIAATVAAGFHVFASKVTASKGLDSALNGVFSTGIAAIIAWGVFLYLGVVPGAWAVIVCWASLNGTAYALGSIARIDALRYIDSTIFFPISKIFGPLLVVVCGVVLLGEHITATQWVGIVGALAIPILLIERTEHVRQKNLGKGILLCLVSIFFSSAIVIIIKEALVHPNALWLFMATANTASMFVSLGIYAHKHMYSKSMLNLSRNDYIVGIGVGFLGFLSGVALIAALQYGYASLVYTIHAHYILIPIFLSVWWYGEHMNLRKFAAVVLSCVTLMLLY